MYYERVISEIDPTVDAAAVESWMRDEYRTLDHLPHSKFVSEIKLFKRACAESPDEMRAIYGV